MEWLQSYSSNFIANLFKTGKITLLSFSLFSDSSSSVLSSCYISCLYFNHSFNSSPSYFVFILFSCDILFSFAFISVSWSLHNPHLFSSPSILLWERGRERGRLLLKMVLNNTCLLECNRGSWRGWKRGYWAGYRVLIAWIWSIYYDETWAGSLQSEVMKCNKSIRFTHAKGKSVAEHVWLWMHLHS